MKSINRILLLIVIFSSIVTTVKAQETMYIYKDGAVVGQHVVAEVDSVIFYQTTQETVTDRDGNEYQTVVIGTQTWMVENLKTTTYNDGTTIYNVTDNALWSNFTQGAYCWYDNDEASYKEPYGALYNWYAVETGKLCPDGWHVPTDAEWKILEISIGMSESIANEYGGRGTTEALLLKSSFGWNNNSNGTNDYGFTALPGGRRSYSQGSFEHVGDYEYWWCSLESDTHGVFYRVLNSNSTTIQRVDIARKSNGFSVRCLKD